MVDSHQMNNRVNEEKRSEYLTLNLKIKQMKYEI